MHATGDISKRLKASSHNAEFWDLRTLFARHLTVEEETSRVQARYVSLPPLDPLSPPGLTDERFEHDTPMLLVIAH